MDLFGLQLTVESKLGLFWSLFVNLKENDGYFIDVVVSCL